MVGRVLEGCARRGQEVRCGALTQARGAREPSGGGGDRRKTNQGGRRARGGDGRGTDRTWRRARMDWKLELVIIPVSDVDRAKAFYTEQVGFHADHDQRVSEGLRFVQLTPPGSACSIALGEGIVEGAPGS